MCCILGKTSYLCPRKFLSTNKYKKEFYEQWLMDNTINGIKILASDINEYRKYW